MSMILLRTLWLLLIMETSALAQSSKEHAIDSIFTGLISANTPGAAVLVIKDGHPVLERGYGVSDLRTRHKIDAQKNFRLASVTKQFTAMAIMSLVHDGKLSYASRLTDVFPDFPVYGKAITIRHLLNHTSGLLDYEDLMERQAEPISPEKLIQIKDAEVLELLKKQDHTKFSPGARWDYSNSGYVVLGVIVGRVSGEPFGEFLQERIFGPLKMRHTIAYERGKNEVPNRAYGNTKQADGWHETDQSPTCATLGDGGIYSSLEDLAKWDAALRDHTLLSEAEMASALTPVKVSSGPPTEPDGTPAEYGFGWFLNPYKGRSRMWHYGETVGFRTAIQRFTADNLTVIVLCNRSDMNAQEMALKISDLYLGN